MGFQNMRSDLKFGALAVKSALRLIYKRVARVCHHQLSFLFYLCDVVSAVYAMATWLSGWLGGWLGGWVSVCHTPVLYQTG